MDKQGNMEKALHTMALLTELRIDFTVVFGGNQTIISVNDIDGDSIHDWVYEAEDGDNE